MAGSASRTTAVGDRLRRSSRALVKWVVPTITASTCTPLGILRQQFGDGSDDNAGGNVGGGGRFGRPHELSPVHQDGVCIGAANVNANEH